MPYSNHHYENCNYVIQAKNSGMGWVDSKRKADTFEEASKQLTEFLNDDSVWMPGKREARIVENLPYGQRNLPYHLRG